MRNYIAKHMNHVNKASVHKDLKRDYLLDNSSAIEEGLSEMTSSFYPELIGKYRQHCYSLLCSDTPILEIKPLPGDESNPVHLLWMLSEIENNTTMSETKCHRWLGFIQAILFTKGSFTIQEERDATRYIFNGL